MKEGLVTKLGCKKAEIFLKLVLREQRKQRKGALVFPGDVLRVERCLVLAHLNNKQSHITAEQNAKICF